MTDLPPPDLKDQAGRLRRLVLALIVGAAVATVAYFIADGLAKPDEHLAAGDYKHGAFRFVFYMTGFFGAAAFITTLAIGNAIAKKKWRQSLVARAEVIRDR